MNFSAWAIRNPVPPILFFAVLVVLGLNSFMQLPITRFPNIDVPIIAISVSQAGAAPAEMETQVTKEIEDAVSSLTGVKHVTSTITDGLSTTMVEFRMEVPSSEALDDVKDAIAKIRTDLPGAIDEPVIQTLDVEGQAIVSFSASSVGMTPEELSWFVDDVVVRRIQGLPGVGRVERIGGVLREIRVELDPERLMALGITASAVNAQLSATNTDLSSGRSEVGGQEQAIRTPSQAQSLEELRATRISLPDGRDARLSDLGEIIDAFEEPRSFARVDGEPAVTFQIYRAKGASDTTVSDNADAAIAELSAEYPQVQFKKVDDSVAYTYGNFESAMETLVEGALLAVVIVFLFLRDWRATLVAAITLPLAAIPTFWAMDLMGFSLNLISLLGVTLVTGILVDDAIVEIENIVRHGRMGKSPYRAAMEAADEIGLAVIAISSTIIAIFAPVSFMGGVAGQYFKQFGITVAVAVFFSLLVARLITPMLAAYFMRTHGHEEEREGFIMRAYTGFLRGTLRFRWLTLVFGLAFFGVSVWATQFLPTGFIPEEDVGRIVASVELPPGSTLDQTSAVTDRIADRIGELEEVESVLVLGGTSPTGTLELRRAAFIITLTHATERELSQQQVEAEIANLIYAVPDVRFTYVNERGDRDVTVGVLGEDGEAVTAAANSMVAEMRDMPLFSNPASGASFSRPEILIETRPDEAADIGVTPATISDTVRVATIGDVDPALSQFADGNRQIPIRVQLNEDARTDLATIETIRVPTSSGGTVPLSAVATIAFSQGPSTIERYDRERLVKVGTDMAPGFTTGDGLETIMALDSVRNMGGDVRIQETGDAEIQAEIFTAFGTAMAAGIMMVMVVLILLFGSVFLPIVILASLPLSVGGVVVALLVTQNAVSMPVVIGILMLMGIVTKNAIMLVDFAVEREKHGMPQREATVDAGRKRARPIVMTTLAMAAGMMPAALGVGDGGEFRAPMAIAVIGGLLTSTVLSLVFIPSFYTMMDDFSRLVGRLLSWMLRPNARDEPGEIAPGATAEEADRHAHPPEARPVRDRRNAPVPANDPGLAMPHAAE